MSKTNDGGPAFPLLKKDIGYHADIRQETVGLSLRDYFAIKILPQVMAEYPNLNDYDQSVTAYRHADAMLRAREEA